jgi:glycosyltransferase 2 family protein
MKQTNHKVLITISLFVLGIMVLALVTALSSDFSKLLSIFSHIQMESLLFSLLCTGIAYLAYTLSFNGLFEMTPYRIPFNKFFSIMFISATVNFIVYSGGLSSIAIRSFLLKHEKVPYAITIPLSFAQNMIFNLVLCIVSFGGLFYLHRHPEFMGGSKEFLIFFFMMVLLVVITLMVLIFYNQPFRHFFLRQLFKVTNGLRRLFRKKNISKLRLLVIRNELESTVKFLHKGWLQLLLVFFWVSMDWSFTALTLYFCFHAVGVHLPLGLLLVGFTVMFLTSNINPVPAGLGVSESALAFTFKLLGVGFEKTLVAALLFRFVFFLLPLAVSTALYLDTIRSFLKAQAKSKTG